MAYIDGFIIPVPKRKFEAYQRLARKAAKIWRDNGALDFKECVADDVKKGKWTSFRRSVKLVQAAVALGYGPQTLPHPPQFLASV